MERNCLDPFSLSFPCMNNKKVGMFENIVFRFGKQEGEFHPLFVHAFLENLPTEYDDTLLKEKTRNISIQVCIPILKIITILNSPHPIYLVHL